MEIALSSLLRRWDVPDGHQKSMLTKIRLRNYMSHSETEIELHPGVNVIIGPNNCGKSAIVSALQTLLGDNDGDYMVRHGQKECVVEIHTDDPHVIVWRRRGGAIRYQVDGKDFARAGRGNFPDGFHECVRLSKVTTSDEKRTFDVHFGEQKSPVFLLESEVDTAKFFSTTSDAERLIKMQELHRKNKQLAMERHKEARRKQAELEAQLSTLAPIDDIRDQIEQSDIEHRRLQEAAAFAEQGTRLYGQWNGAVAECRQLQRVVSECSELREPPVLVETAPIERAIGNLRGAQLAAEEWRGRYGALMSLRPSPVLDDTSALENAIQQLTRTQWQQSRSRESLQELRKLNEPPAQAEVLPLTRLVAAIGQAQREQAQWCAVLERLQIMPEQPTLQDPAGLQRQILGLTQAEELVRRESKRLIVLTQLQEPISETDLSLLAESIVEMHRASGMAEQYRLELERLVLELAEVERCVTAWRVANPTCPTCGQTITNDPLHLGDTGPEGANRDPA